MPDATHEQTWHDALRADLARRENAGLLRRLRPLEPGAGLLTRIDEQGRPIGKPLINLASNDYLGLSHHPHLIDAAVRATQRFGTGAGASRLVTGTGPLHQQTERAFAAFKHADAALLFPTGYMANLAVLATLAQRWTASLVPGHPVALQPLITLRPTHGMRMVLHQRATSSSVSP